MKRSILLLGGFMAAVVYVVTVVLGGVVRPGYSHISQAVSELIEAGAPNTGLLNPLFLLYNLLTAAFAVGLWLVGSDDKEHPRTIRAAAAVLLVEAVAGFAMVFFPQDIPGTPATVTGSVHLVLAGLCSLGTMAAILLMALWFRGVAAFPGYGLYSLLTLLFVFIAGGAAAFTTAAGIPFNGLMERLTIGGFLQWMLVLGWRLYYGGRSRDS